MKDKILTHLNHPDKLERLYRANKVEFRKAFGPLYPQLKGNTIADCWNERLSYEGDDLNWGSPGEWLFVIGASLVAAFTAKLPKIFAISEDFFFPRNIGFVVFPVLIAYFAWKYKLSVRKIATVVLAGLVGLVFINYLPDMKTSDTLQLSCIHLVLFLWALLGFTFTGNGKNNMEKRLAYLKYNGDLVVMTAVMAIAGGLMTAITIGLFKVIGFDIQAFYFEYIVFSGLAAAPLIGTFLTQTNPQLVGKVSPVIARIFSPLVLVMLVIYLTAMVFSGKDPYNDRAFLLIFNVLLIGVMALIFFSVADASKTTRTRAENWVLFLLSGITAIVNVIALSAILFRISEWGITPNRLAVLGSNVLILIHLLLVFRQLFRVASGKAELSAIGKSICSYLPVYVIWTIIVTFIFPFIFQFK